MLNPLKSHASLIAFAITISCSSSHKSHSAPAPQDNVPIKKPAGPKPDDAPELTSAEILKFLLVRDTFKCIKTPEGSLYLSINILKDATPDATSINVYQTRFTDDHCGKVDFQIALHGSATASKYDGKQGEVSIQFDKDFFIFRGNVPASLKDSCEKVEHRLSNGLAASSVECGLKLGEYKATWKLTGNPGEVEVEAVDDSLFGFARPARLVSMESTYRGYFSVEELACGGDDRPHFWERGTNSCRIQGEVDSASADSAIQYEKGSGLFVAIKDDRKVLAKASGAMQYVVNYDYSCSVSYYFRKQLTDANFVFLIGTEDEGRYIKLGKHSEEFLTRKDLQLDMERNILEDFAGPFQVEPGCSLTIETTAKQLSN